MTNYLSYSKEAILFEIDLIKLNIPCSPFLIYVSEHLYKDDYRHAMFLVYAFIQEHDMVNKDFSIVLDGLLVKFYDYEQGFLGSEIAENDTPKNKEFIGINWHPGNTCLVLTEEDCYEYDRYIMEKAK